MTSQLRVAKAAPKFIGYADVVEVTYITHQEIYDYGFAMLVLIGLAVVTVVLLVMLVTRVTRDHIATSMPEPSTSRELEPPVINANINRDALTRRRNAKEAGNRRDDTRRPQHARDRQANDRSASSSSESQTTTDGPEVKLLAGATVRLLRGGPGIGKREYAGNIARVTNPTPDSGGWIKVEVDEQVIPWRAKNLKLEPEAE